MPEAPDDAAGPAELGPLLQIVGDLSLPRAPLPIPCHVQGWAWAPAEVVRVTVAVDGVAHEALYGLPSLEVVEGLRIPEARYAAFFCLLDSGRLEPGPHRITVTAVDGGGRAASWSRDVWARTWPSTETGPSPSPSPIPPPSGAARSASVLGWVRDRYTRAYAELIAARAQDHEADVRLASAMIRLREAGLEAPAAPEAVVRSSARPGYRGLRQLAVALAHRLRRAVAG